MKISKTSRVLSVYHLFLNCEEVSFQEFILNFGASQRTALRDIRLLKQAGVLEARWDRARQAFIPVTLEPFPPEEQENRTRQKYLEKLRRLCIDNLFHVEKYDELADQGATLKRVINFLDKLKSESHERNADNVFVPYEESHALHESLAEKPWEKAILQEKHAKLVKKFMRVANFETRKKT